MEGEKSVQNGGPDHQVFGNGDRTVAAYIKPQARKLHDPDVTFEEYHYYALRTREEENALPAPKTKWGEILLRKKPSHDAGNGAGVDNDKIDHTEVNFAKSANRIEISDREW